MSFIPIEGNEGQQASVLECFEFNISQFQTNQALSSIYSVYSLMHREDLVKKISDRSETAASQ